MCFELTSGSSSSLRSDKNSKDGNGSVKFRREFTRKSEATASTPKVRIALYSHDTMGLGHMRRNLLIAQTLSAPPLNASILMIAGACQISKFTFPTNVDCLSLPSLCKNPDGRYGSRHLDVSLQELILLRSRTIRSALASFRPDLLIVDNVPRGAVRELDDTLPELQGRTRMVLGLRDVLDAPEHVRTEWEQADNLNAIRKYYDAVWVYGDQSVYDPVSEYNFPADIARKVRFVGYLDQTRRLNGALREQSENLTRSELPKGPLSVCSVGGGQDGIALAETFAKAQFPSEHQGIILTGPFMPAESRRQLTKEPERNSQVRVIDFIDEPMRLLSQAERLVSMGGYNTTCEVLSLNIPALIVPRVEPREEQLVRAVRLSALGFLDLLHPSQLTPQKISDWLAGEKKLENRNRIDLDGLNRLSSLAQDVLYSAAPATKQSLHGGISK